VDLHRISLHEPRFLGLTLGMLEGKFFVVISFEHLALMSTLSKPIH
jgi:hypothetical protein